MSGINSFNPVLIRSILTTTPGSGFYDYPYIPISQTTKQLRYGEVKKLAQGHKPGSSRSGIWTQMSYWDCRLTDACSSPRHYTAFWCGGHLRALEVPCYHKPAPSFLLHTPCYSMWPVTTAGGSGVSPWFKCQLCNSPAVWSLFLSVPQFPDL